MKTKLLLMTIFAFTSLSSFAQANDIEAIKKVLVNEREAFFAHDLSKWSLYRVQDASTSVTVVNENFFTSVKGWDSLHRFAARIFKQPAISVTSKDNNPSYRINGNLAWVEFDQQNTTTENGKTDTRLSQEKRVLVKENGQWKILSQISVAAPETWTSSKPEDIERNINATGYRLLAGNNIDQAIEVFKLNVKLYPNAWNTYDSLGEAYALAGNKQLAIENYETSVKLNPKNDNGIELLKKLRM